MKIVIKSLSKSIALLEVYGRLFQIRLKSFFCEFHIFFGNFITDEFST
jgi:hypothetical protein